MTLLIAADVQDHLIVAGDHCAVMSRVSTQGPPEVTLDNYRKVYPWKYGAIAASGDVFLMVHFCRLFLHHEGLGHPLDLLQIAKEAKMACVRNGARSDASAGSIFLTLPGAEGFSLYHVCVTTDMIDFEIIEAIGTRFSMREERAPDESVCQAFTSRLRPAIFFGDSAAFSHYHIDLLKTFFARQNAVDEMVTSSFDVCLLEKRTGVHTFWHISEPPKQLAAVDLGEASGSLCLRGKHTEFTRPLVSGRPCVAGRRGG
ncbi:MAG: hypothetical protein ACREPV_12170 [Lysobacter sp.]